MNIKILGTGCTNCKKLYQTVEEVTKEIGVDAELEKVEDIQIIMSYGVMSAPALVVNEEVKFSGKVPNKEEIKNYIQNEMK